MRHKIVSLRKPIDARILETGVTGEYELYIQHETGVENLSGISVRDLVVLSQTIDCFLDDTKADTGLTDEGQSDILDGEGGEMSDSDLLTNLMVAEVAALLSVYPDYKTVERAFHAYAVRQGFTVNIGTLWSDEKNGELAMNMQEANPNLGYESAIEFAQKIRATTDISLGLEILRNALNHEDEE